MKKRVLSLMLATVMCMALAVTANAVEYDSSMVNLGERAGSVLSVEQTSLINGNFPKNVRGETYGTALMGKCRIYRLRLGRMARRDMSEPVI